MFRDRIKRKKVLPIFFETYVQLVYDQGSLYATSSELEAIVLTYEDRKGNSKFVYLIKKIKNILKALKALKYISIKEFLRGLRILNKMDSSWIYEKINEEFIHLDMIAVKKEYKGQKLSSKLIRYIIEESKRRKIFCTLETHNLKNVGIYNHFGFEIVEVIEIPDSNLKQYCMVYKDKS
ncbi:acetyltransferase [Gottschalkia purinilytica]|uniref:Acetyltransferase n=1 Tax=Gottschalkia purinilytica TaxID=1503 RepID=A0A0L0WF41_GOTPU|nr:GNAT family N-acetyltransferase [Gottschalkia purinilytica]KNF10089.1 acetyltransferase [Gottschalkia purinilytica]